MSGDIVSTDSAMEALSKLLPSQVTAAFLGVRAVVDMASPADGSMGNVVAIVMIGFITLMTPVVAYWILGVKNRVHLLSLAITFLVWAVNIEYARIVNMAISNPDFWALMLPIGLILWSAICLPVIFHIIRIKQPITP
jgi:hypothetical protein